MAYFKSIYLTEIQALSNLPNLGGSSHSKHLFCHQSNHIHQHSINKVACWEINQVAKKRGISCIISIFCIYIYIHIISRDTSRFENHQLFQYHSVSREVFPSIQGRSNLRGRKQKQTKSSSYEKTLGDFS